MAIYLGYTADDVTWHLVGHGRSLRRARAAVESTAGVRKCKALPEISVAEQIARRERIASNPLVTATSDMRPVGSLRPIPAQSRSVRAWESGHLVRVRAFSLIAMSLATLVDDGDWQYHWEWSDWSIVE